MASAPAKGFASRLPWLLACALVLAGCGLQPASQFIPDVSAGPELEKYEGFDGAPITVSSSGSTP